ncbi:MAG: glycosyltransferase, partial [Candidatus Omnitrophica bacterium]|nr:glycosyltransferase [Candidatus Omnitrophota bacterium]
MITKLELGGAQNQVLSLIKHLDQSKFRLFLFTAQDGLLIPEAEAIKGLTLRKSRCLERPINPLRDFLALIAIYRFIKKNNIRIVHTHSSKAGILGRMAAKLAKVGVIIHTVHGWSFNDYQPGLVRWFYIWLERIIAQFTDSIIVVSSHDKQQGIANRIGADNKYSIIHYGIDYAQFSVKGQGIREELGISASDLMVCMVSCFKPQKSPQDFIRLASLINESFPNAKFILVGDGILREKIERLIHKLNLQGQVILTGWRRDIPR